MAYELSQAGKVTDQIWTMFKLHEADIKRKPDLDTEIREARTTLPTAGGIPDRGTAEAAAAPLVAEHRAIVDRMKAFTAALLQAAKA